MSRFSLKISFPVKRDNRAKMRIRIKNFKRKTHLRVFAKERPKCFSK
jgi:hypothetical protein